MNSSHLISRQSTGFDRLEKPVQRWIWTKGWTDLRDIQERSIPALLDGQNDLIVAAATASGKTEAVFLPLLSELLSNSRGDGFNLVYIGPTKALINDQFERLEDLCATLGLPVYPWHGDISQSTKERARKLPGGVLLITPESLEALFVLRGMEVPALFAATRAIVIDELHALLDNERGVHLRSLLARIEIAVNRTIRRVGLSATLGDMALVKKYLRPESPDSVQLLESASGGREIRVQLRAYVEKTGVSHDDSAAKRSLTDHLFHNLRGSDNLIFAESRQNVEYYADRLRQKSEDARVPNEFYPHHANLSRQSRVEIEKRLKSSAPVTAVCTSTLELGIDIGNIACYAQIGPPYSVASLHQRLGRSGRVAGQVAVLRMYATECQANESSHPLDRLHLRLVRAIAMLELMIEGWCEPPAPQSLHLSTLTHQILSVVAENSGASAERVFHTLCKVGPFQSVDVNLFIRVLRQMGSEDVNLLEQSPDGLLLLGEKGERLVNHYNFFAVFQTPQEYRITADGRELGSMTLIMMISEGMTFVFSGRRWRIDSIDYRSRVIRVSSSREGKPPIFGGGAGIVHDTIVLRMRQMLAAEHIPEYLDSCARTLLLEARAEFRRLGLDSTGQVQLGATNFLLATWAGTVKNATLAVALRNYGYRATVYDGLLDVTNVARRRDFLENLDELGLPQGFDENALLTSNLNLVAEKFHPYLSRDLLLKDALSCRFDADALPELVRRLNQSA